MKLNEGFFETVSISRNKKEPLKRGRGSQRQTSVLVSVESKPVEEEQMQTRYKTNKKVKFLEMKVIKNLKKDTITQSIEKYIKSRTTISSDASTSYNDLAQNYNLHSQVIPKKDINKVLPWVHTAISNAKRLFLDAHNRIDDDFLQSYLNEFCFKFNRRYFDNIFDRIMIAAVSYRWDYLGEVSR